MKKLEFKGIKFLIVVLILYALLFFVNFKDTNLAFLKSIEVLYSLLPIFVLIIFISALINYFLKPKHIIKHLGEDSGFRGILYAMLSGILSHGPMYMWYGIVNEVRSSGAKDKLVIIFLYARAVKIPLLVFMVDVFGLAFTITMTLLTILASIMQGYLFEYLNKRI